MRKTKAELIKELRDLRREVNKGPAERRQDTLSTKEYQSIIESAHDAFWVASSDGEIMDANESALSMLGYGREEFLGMHISMIEASENPEETEAHIRHIMEKGSDLFESRHRTRDGEILDVEVSVNYHTNERGGGNFFSFVRDISDRKRMEAELESTGKRLEHVLSSTPAVIYMCRAYGDFGSTFVSENVREMMGYTPEECLGNPNFWREGLHPDEAGDVLKGFEGLFEKGHLQHEYRFRRKDGKYIWVYDELRLVYAEDGSPLEMVGYWSDITRRKMVEEELNASEMNLKQAQRMAKVGSWSWDIVGNRLTWSDEIYRIFGLEKGVGLSYDTFLGTVHPEDLESVRGHVAEALEGRKAYSLHHRIIRPDGTERIVQEQAEVACDSGGKPVSMFGTVQDITERKLAEQELEKYRESLEEMVAERTGELQEALRRARESDKLKDEFMANISHELRTPLSGVIGITELLLETELAEDQRESLRLIASSADSLLVIINDLLDFSKVKAGSLQLHEVPFNLRELFGDTIDFFVIGAREKGVSLLFDVNADVPDFLVGDDVRLRQVLVNLIGNAIKFTEEGSVCVKVRLGGMEGEEARINFAVVDTGIGIAKEHRGKIFDSFSQADGSITRKFGGTGLGLSISSKLVRLMGGELEVESTPGEGSTFHFSVPLGLQSGDDIRSSVTVDKGDAEISGSPNPLTILLAEDNEINQHLAIRIMERAGHKVKAVSNGKEALESLEHDSFDVVIMDIMMPVMGGAEAVRAIRAREELTGEHIPVIALTANAIRGDKEKFISNGMDYYLSKPLRARDLVSLLEDIADIQGR